MKIIIAWIIIVCAVSGIAHLAWWLYFFKEEIFGEICILFMAALVLSCSSFALLWAIGEVTK